VVLLVVCGGGGGGGGSAGFKMPYISNGTLDRDEWSDSHSVSFSSGTNIICSWVGIKFVTEKRKFSPKNVTLAVAQILKTLICPDS